MSEALFRTLLTAEGRNITDNNSENANAPEKAEC